MLASELLKRILVDGDGGIAIQSGARIFAAQGPAPLGVVQGTFMSAEIDLVTTGTYVVVPPLAVFASRIGGFWRIATKGGTVSVAPTFSIGTNVSINDLCPSQTPAAFTTQAVGSQIGLTATNPVIAPSIATNGVRVQVTAGATGAAPVLTARLVLPFILSAVM